MQVTIGVLSLQGAFAKHIQSLELCGANTLLVRTPKLLSLCDALIIPGGESTTMMKQLNYTKLIEPIKEFGLKNPILGTCAGAILLSKVLENDGGVCPLGMMNITTERNAYGRQNDSFKAKIPVNFSSNSTFEAVFIRAPSFKELGPNVEILASFNEEPVFVKEGHCLAATFHPELTKETCIHEHLINLAIQNKQQTLKSSPSTHLLHQA